MYSFDANFLRHLKFSEAKFRYEAVLEPQDTHCSFDAAYLPYDGNSDTQRRKCADKNDFYNPFGDGWSESDISFTSYSHEVYSSPCTGNMNLVTSRPSCSIHNTSNSQSAAQATPLCPEETAQKG